MLYIYAICKYTHYPMGLLDEQIGGSIDEPYLHPHPLLTRDTIIIPSMPSKNPAATHIEEGTGNSGTFNSNDKFILVDR